MNEAAKVDAALARIVSELGKDLTDEQIENFALDRTDTAVMEYLPRIVDAWVSEWEYNGSYAKAATVINNAERLGIITPEQRTEILDKAAKQLSHKIIDYAFSPEPLLAKSAKEILEEMKANSLLTAESEMAIKTEILEGLSRRAYSLTVTNFTILANRQIMTIVDSGLLTEDEVKEIRDYVTTMSERQESLNPPQDVSELDKLIATTHTRGEQAYYRSSNPHNGIGASIRVNQLPGENDKAVILVKSDSGSTQSIKATFQGGKVIIEPHLADPYAGTPDVVYGKIVDTFLRETGLNAEKIEVRWPEAARSVLA